ncbi:hypothetical protein L873DRAFT_1801818, partial [Choiromyces venosus 120613-1]
KSQKSQIKERKRAVRKSKAMVRMKRQKLEVEARGGVIKNSFRAAGRRQSIEIGMLENYTSLEQLQA